MKKNKFKLNNKSLYNKFLGVLIKKGNKKKAKKILNSSLSKVLKRIKIKKFRLNKILLVIFSKLNCFVEIRKIQRRKSTHLIPFPVKVERRIYLAIKWILFSINKNRLKIPLADKLAVEILKIMLGKNCQSIKEKESNLAQALKNKSNVHFRW